MASTVTVICSVQIHVLTESHLLNVMGFNELFCFCELQQQLTLNVGHKLIEAKKNNGLFLCECEPKKYSKFKQTSRINTHLIK